MIKNLIIKGVTGGLVFFFLGWLVYGYLLANYMSSQCTEEYASVMRSESEMVWWAMIAGSLAIGFLLSYVLVNLENPTRWAQVYSSAIVGFFYASAVDLMNYSMMKMSTVEFIFVDIIVFTVQAAIIGFLISFVGNRQ